ncbi:MAG: serine hydrolase [Candidatus Jorgensenbacteria bacterium]
MKERWQSIVLILIILISAELTHRNFEVATPVASSKTISAAPETSTPIPAPGNVSFKRASILEVLGGAHRAPVRKWDVPDPTPSARGALLYSLDDDMTLWGMGVENARPTASVIKLLTAVTVLENLGENKKVAVSETAIAADGDAGELQSGEVYRSQDLLRVMLLTSSNDAASVFAEAGGGEREFVRVMQGKALKIGMTGTHIDDPAGLSDLTTATPNDLLRLVRYILANHPQIFSWSRVPQFLVQPLNDPTSRTAQNINPLVNDARFLGGKTGTLESAGENLVGVLSFHDKRLVAVILGSTDRVRDVNLILDWAERAYEL